jgi:hypothetical protein
VNRRPSATRLRQAIRGIPRDIAEGIHTAVDVYGPSAVALLSAALILMLTTWLPR